MESIGNCPKCSKHYQRGWFDGRNNLMKVVEKALIDAHLKRPIIVHVGDKISALDVARATAANTDRMPCRQSLKKINDGEDTSA